MQIQIIKSDSKIQFLLQGCDSAGKDGVIKRILHHLSPRGSRAMKPGRPSDRLNYDGKGESLVTSNPTILFAYEQSCLSKGNDCGQRMRLGGLSRFFIEILGGDHRAIFNFSMRQTHLDLMAVDKLALLLGLSFFLGLSFEGFYWQSARSRPGGIRTFPIIAFCGAFLFAIEPHFAAPFCVGLVVLGHWLYPYYQAEVSHTDGADVDTDGIMVPLCNIVAYVLGPITVTQPPWVAIGFAIVTVLLLRARDRLHALANKIPSAEIITLAQFLVLIGVVLPLLPNKPVTELTKITPFQVWLAVVVVSSLSYGSYLLQKLLSTKGSLFFTSVLGGLYSSTATTVVLARRLKQASQNGNEFRSGIVLATSLMYLRLGVVIAIFNVPLAIQLAPRLVALAVSGVVMAAVCLWWRGRTTSLSSHEVPPPNNPLELTAGMVFAVLFVVISIMSAWVTAHFGHVGIYWLAAIVGVTDIDPFVLSVAQGSVAGLDNSSTATAILLASSSNNLLKSAYSISFAGFWKSLAVVISLLLLSAIGCVLAITS